MMMVYLSCHSCCISYWLILAELDKRVDIEVRGNKEDIFLELMLLLHSYQLVIIANDTWWRKKWAMRTMFLWVFVVCVSYWLVIFPVDAEEEKEAGDNDNYVCLLAMLLLLCGLWLDIVAGDVEAEKEEGNDDYIHSNDYVFFTLMFLLLCVLWTFPCCIVTEEETEQAMMKMVFKHNIVVVAVPTNLSSDMGYWERWGNHDDVLQDDVVVAFVIDVIIVANDMGWRKRWVTTTDMFCNKMWVHFPMSFSLLQLMMGRESLQQQQNLKMMWLCVNCHLLQLTWRRRKGPRWLAKKARWSSSSNDNPYDKLWISAMMMLFPNSQLHLPLQLSSLLSPLWPRSLLPTLSILPSNLIPPNELTPMSQSPPSTLKTPQQQHPKPLWPATNVLQPPALFVSILICR